MQSNPSRESSSQRICLKLCILPAIFLWFTGDTMRWCFLLHRKDGTQTTAYQRETQMEPLGGCEWVNEWVTQSCLTLCDPTDYTVHGILQARTLEWVAFPFSRGSSQPSDRTQVSHIAGRFFTSWATSTRSQNVFDLLLCTHVSESVSGMLVLVIKP